MIWPAAPSPPSVGYLLAIGQVDAREEWILFRPRLPCVVLIEEDRGTAQLQPQLLDALLIVNGDQEGLAAFLGFHGSQDGEVLRKVRLWNRGQDEKPVGEPSRGKLRLGQLRDPANSAVGGAPLQLTRPKIKPLQPHPPPGVRLRVQGILETQISLGRPFW